MKNLELSVVQFEAEDVIATSGLCSYLGATHGLVEGLDVANGDYKGNLYICDTYVDRAPSVTNTLRDYTFSASEPTQTEIIANGDGWYFLDGDGKWNRCDEQGDVAHNAVH